MSIIYTQHPTGYPQTVYATQGRPGHWYVTVDTWQTATDHDGPRRVGPDYYLTRRAAEDAARAAGERED